VELCGHATLASAKVLFSLNPKAKEIRFTTRFSGQLIAKKVSEDGEIEITLPITKLDDSKTPDDAGICDALGVKKEDVLVIQATGGEGGGLVIEVKEDLDIRTLMPKFKALVSSS
jgi:predicted PhzF superfamily epimerase YddE/YHI9